MPGYAPADRQAAPGAGSLRARHQRHGDIGQADGRALAAAGIPSIRARRSAGGGPPLSRPLASGCRSVRGFRNLAQSADGITQTRYSLGAGQWTDVGALLRGLEAAAARGIGAPVLL